MKADSWSYCQLISFQCLDQISDFNIIDLTNVCMNDSMVENDRLVALVCRVLVHSAVPVGTTAMAQCALTGLSVHADTTQLSDRPQSTHCCNSEHKVILIFFLNSEKKTLFI